MTDNIKILAQLSPSPASLTDFYVVPSSTSAAISSIIICNQNNFPISFRVALAQAGAANNVKQYMYYDLPLDENDTFIATVGMTLSSADVIRVQTDNSNVSFMLFGVELV